MNFVFVYSAGVITSNGATHIYGVRYVTSDNFASVTNTRSNHYYHLSYNSDVIYHTFSLYKINWIS